MAELRAGPLGDGGAPTGAVRGSRPRERSYRGRRRSTLVGSLVVGIAELGEVLVVFLNVDRPRRASSSPILLVFGLAVLAFSGGTSPSATATSCRVPAGRHARGLLPAPPAGAAALMVRSDIQLRRLSHAAVGLAALVGGPGGRRRRVARGHGGPAPGGPCSPGSQPRRPVRVGRGAQFFLVDGAEVTNAFVYGGRYASTQPA